jgi:hypothetical protein
VVADLSTAGLPSARPTEELCQSKPKLGTRREHLHELVDRYINISRQMSHSLRTGNRCRATRVVAAARDAGIPEHIPIPQDHDREVPACLVRRVWKIISTVAG